MAESVEHKSNYLDFRYRRSVHIALRSETHKQLRKALVERDISMQEMFQRFSELIVSHDKRATKILDDLEKDKRTGNIQKITQPRIDTRNAKAIYDIIAEESEIEATVKDTDDDD